MAFYRGITLFCCLYLSTSLIGQCDCNVKSGMYVAEQHYRQEKVSQETIELYALSFSCGLKDVSKVLDAISCAAMIGDTQHTVSFMTYGMKTGLSTGDYRRLWEHLGHGIHLDALLGIIDTSAAKDVYHHRLLPDKISKLRECAERDQAFRDTPDMDWNRQWQNDSINWKVIRELVTTYGYLPTYAELGLEGSEDLELILYHMPLDELKWLAHYIIEAEINFESNLAHTFLYQLERIGMDAGLIYTITDDHQIVVYGPRTQMENKMWCQAFGEWFDEQDPHTGQYYFTPVDPTLTKEEVDRVRALLCLDDLSSALARKPWVKSVSVEDFERIFDY